MINPNCMSLSFLFSFLEISLLSLAQTVKLVLENPSATCSSTLSTRSSFELEIKLSSKSGSCKGHQKTILKKLPVKDMAHEVLARRERAADEPKKVISELEPPTTGN